MTLILLDDRQMQIRSDEYPEYLVDILCSLQVNIVPIVAGFVPKGRKRGRYYMQNRHV